MKFIRLIFLALAIISLSAGCDRSEDVFLPGSAQRPSTDDGNNDDNQGDTGEDPGQDPGEDPGQDPGEDPGQDPGENPGDNPGDSGQDTPDIPDMPSLTPIPNGGALGTSNYSKLTASNHPRIIFKQSDFDAIKSYAQTATGPFKTIHDQIISIADASVGKPNLTRTLSGKRLLDVSRNAMQRILACAYAYKTTGQSKYLTQAEKDINTVCGFSDWNARQHWLDVGEMAAGVAIGYDWLYKELKSDTKTKARTALQNFCFTPAQNGTWNLDFYNSDGNWNQVCNGGIIAAALAMYENNTSLCQSMINKSVSTNGTAVASMYKPDGSYPEGYSYWNYGTEYQALINTMLYTAMGSDAGLTTKEGFSKTGKYMLFMEGSSGVCFNYADCAASSACCLAQWYFAWKYADVSHLYMEKRRISSYAGCSESRILPLIAFYAYKMKIPSLESITPPSQKIWVGNSSAQTPVLLAHGNWNMDATDKFLGLKGGKANTSHGHMDAGSFVYDYKGVRWSADLGLQSYGTLEPYINLWNMNDGSERWSVFRYKNTSHSTITINDKPHRVAGKATITSSINSNGRLGGVVDMSAAVSNEASKVVRTIYMEGDDLIVQDQITALSTKDAKVRWTMCTSAKPTIEYGAITLEAKGRTLFMKKSSTTGHNVSWKTWFAEGTNSWDASNSGYYLCGYEVTVAKGSTANITIKLTPNE